MSRAAIGLLLISIPAMTGLASVLWARLVRLGPEVAQTGNAASIALVLAFLVTTRGAPKSLSALCDGRSAWIFGTYIILSALITVAWMTALDKRPLPVIALLEISYPFFILIFTPLLFEPVRLGPQQVIGALLVACGALLLVLAEPARAQG